jgi:PAS domain S-box-containing protein
MTMSSTMPFLDYHSLFEALPGRYLILLPNAPIFTIAAVSTAYLHATMTQREGITGRGLFEVLSENILEVTQVADLQASLEAVLQSHASQTMAVQKYKVPRHESEGGGFEERYWSPVNSPVFDEAGEVMLLVHCLKDVTDLVMLRAQGQQELRQDQENQTSSEQYAAQNLLRVEALEETNSQLRALLAVRKQADVALRENEDLFRATFEQAAVGIAHVTLEGGQLLRINRKFCEILGYSHQDLLERTFKEITHPDDLSTDFTFLRQMLAGEISTYSLEKRYFRKDGSVVWGNLTVSLARQPSGEPKYFISVIEDITERKQAEEALQASEARQSLLLRLMQRQRETSDPDVMMAATSEAVGRFLGVNRVGFFEMADKETLVFRISWTDGVLAPLTGTFPTTGISVLYCAEEQTGHTLSIADITLSPLTDDLLFGTGGARSVIGTPIIRGGLWHAGFYVNHSEVRHWTDEEIALVRETGQQTWDAVERARGETALREKEERYRLALETGHIGAWDWDVVNQHVTWSDRVYMFYGMEPGTFSGTLDEFARRIHPEDLERVSRAIQAALEGRQPYNMECRLLRPNGEVRWIATRGQVFWDEHGQPIRMLGATTDITERIQAQREIEALNARLQRSMTETHHRVKNNLQVISALAEMQMEDGTDSVPVSALARIGQHTRSLAAIHDLLTQESKIKVGVDTISIRTALTQLVSLLQATAGERPLRAEIDEFALPIQESTSLVMLVSELVSNSLKHGRGAIHIILRQQDNQAELEVSDDGPGFPVHFNPRTSGNTGLGLIDSTGRYDLRGTIFYENRAEGGARIRVIFPISE